METPRPLGKGVISCRLRNLLQGKCRVCPKESENSATRQALEILQLRYRVKNKPAEPVNIPNSAAKRPRNKDIFYPYSLREATARIVHRLRSAPTTCGCPREALKKSSPSLAERRLTWAGELYLHLALLFATVRARFL